MTEQDEQSEQPPLIPGKFVEANLNFANKNLIQAFPPGSRADGHTLAKMAELQIAAAQAAAILELANAIRESANPAWVNTIRYGLGEVAKAVQDLQPEDPAQDA